MSDELVLNENAQRESTNLIRMETVANPLDSFMKVLGIIIMFVTLKVLDLKLGASLDQCLGLFESKRLCQMRARRESSTGLQLIRKSSSDFL
jgi:hypothetical protein